MTTQCPECDSFLIMPNPSTSTVEERCINELQVIDHITSAVTSRIDRPTSPTFMTAARDVLQLGMQFDLVGGLNTSNLLMLDPIVRSLAFSTFQEEEPIRPLTPSTFQHRHIHRKDIRNEEMCVICYELLQHAEKVCELPCKHIFHDSCIREWFKRKSTCPMCRKQLTDPRTKHSERAMPPMRTFILMIG